MKLSVIICTYDRPKLLARTLNHLSEQSMPDDDFEVIVVYNEEVADTEDVLEEYEGVFEHYTTVTEDPNSDESGLAHARNRGIGVAKSEYVLFLDDDVRPSTDLLTAVRDTFRTVDPEPICIGGRVVPDFQGEVPSWLPDSLPGLPVCRLGDEPYWIDFPEEFVIGANVAFQREFLHQEGGFPTELGRQQGTLLANEELELLRAADERTGVYYQPKAHVEHYIGEDRLRLRYFLRRFYWQGVSDSRSEHYGHNPRDSPGFVHALRSAGSLVKNALGVVVGPGQGSRMLYLFQVFRNAGYLSEEMRLSLSERRPGVLRSWT